jgi:hypothetical protein
MNMIRKIVLVSLFVSLSLFVSAQEEDYISLFIYNFTRYFEWPEDRRTGDFVIEIMGHESVYKKLSEITANRTVGNQKIVVRSITSPDNMGNPHIIMIGHWHSRHIQKVLGKIGNIPTLVITDHEGMIKEGSAINFVIRDGGIKFELKKMNATKYGLKVHSRLDNMAILID